MKPGKMPMTKNRIYIATDASVVAIDKNTGRALWKTELPGSAFGSGRITTIALDDSQIYAHTQGWLFCLEQKTGRILWSNELKGLGFKPCIIAVPNFLNTPQSETVIIDSNYQRSQSGDTGAAG